MSDSSYLSPQRSAAHRSGKSSLHSAFVLSLKEAGETGWATGCCTGLVRPAGGEERSEWVSTKVTERLAPRFWLGNGTGDVDRDRKEGKASQGGSEERLLARKGQSASTHLVTKSNS